LKTVNLKE